jgi:hypothetical protein
MGARRLALRREALAELTPGDLAGVVGAYPTPVVRTLPVDDCIVFVSLQCLTDQPRCF